MNFEKFMYLVFFISANISVLCLILICGFLGLEGFPFIKSEGVNFLLGKVWSPSDAVKQFGIFPMIIGSFYTTGLSLLWSLPIGIFTAVFLSNFCPKKLKSFLKFFNNLLSGVPSIVYGFFGLIVLVPAIRKIFGGSGNSILTASILLAVMILPTIIEMSENAISSVPKEQYEGALALGATPEKAIFKVVVPTARHGIFSAAILAIGRAIGETMAVITVCGNQARMPKGITEGIRTLTSNIVMELGYAEGNHKKALIATALVLLVIVFFMNVCLTFIKSK